MLCTVSPLCTDPAPEADPRLDSPAEALLEASRSRARLSFQPRKRKKHEAKHSTASRKAARQRPRPRRLPDQRRSDRDKPISAPQARRFVSCLLARALSRYAVVEFLSLSLSLLLPSGVRGGEGPPATTARSLSLSLPGQERRANPDPSARGRAPAGQGGVFETPPGGYALRRLGCTRLRKNAPQSS